MDSEDRSQTTHRVASLEPLPPQKVHPRLQRKVELLRKVTKQNFDRAAREAQERQRREG